MKKLYSLLLVILFAAGLSQAYAEEYAVTLKWDKPDAVEFKYGGTSLGATQNVVLDVPQGSTDYVFTTTSKTKPLFVAAKDGFKITKATCVSAAGASSNIAVSTLNGVTYLRLNLSAWQSPLIGGTVTIVTEALQTASPFTIKVNDCLDKIKKVYLEPSKKEISLTNGSNSTEFTTGQENSLTIEVTDRSTPQNYTVTNNGAPVDFDTDSQCFIINPLAANDVIEISYTNTTPVETVTLQLPEEIKDCITSVFDRNALANLTVTDGKFEVEQGHRVAFNINSDYTVTKVTFNGTLVDESTTGLASFSFVVNESGTLAFEGTAKVYNDITYTAYVVCPEGVRIVAGSLLTGYTVSLTDGETMAGAIELPAISKPAQAAYTIPAGTARKFTFKVSEKYGALNIQPQEGYWIRTLRTAGGQYLDLPTTVTTFYVVAEKIEDDAQAHVFVSIPDDREIIFDADITNGCTSKFTYTNGWSELSFDKDYMSPFSARVRGESIAGTYCFLDGKAVSPDDYSRYSLPVADGGVVKIFADGKEHKSNPLTVTNLHGSVAFEQYPGSFVAYTDQSLVDGTTVKVTVDPGYTLKVGGQDVTLTDGSYTFETTTAATTVEFVAGAELLTAVLTPESGSTVPSLTEILVSFPMASTAEIAGLDISEVTLVGAGNVWGNIPTQTKVEKVEGAEVPTFKVEFLVAPTQNLSYTLVISEGFFKVEGSDSKEIQASYVLETTTEVTYEPTPTTGFFNATDPWSTIGFMFPDFSVTAGANYGDIKVSFDGKELTPDAEYMAMAEDTFFAIMLTEAPAREGVLTIEIPEGGLNLSGKPCPAIKHSWTGVVPSEFTMVVETLPYDEGDIRRLNEITVSFPGAKTASRYDEAVITLRLKPDYSKPGSQAWSATATATEVEGADVPTFKLTFDQNPTEFGDYILTMPEGAFVVDEVANSEYFTHTYSLTSGVADISIDGTVGGAVFNLQGIALDCEWDELPAGFYIRGGKVVLKK